MKNNLFKILVALLCLFSGWTTGNAQSHLVLSEITLAPSEGEFIEIYNPGGAAVSLDNYYLADNNNYAGLPESGLMIDLGDFIARFPDGYTIQPHQAIVVAMGGTDFASQYAVVPHFEIISQSATVTDMVNAGGSGTPALSNAGEAVVLFYWDGVSDLVKDVDIMYAGVPTNNNMLVPKTGFSIDGPDANSTPSTYMADAATIPVQNSTPDIGYSTKRMLPETGYEIVAGGNGITGNDETSENIAVTWDSAFTAPTPGVSELATGLQQVTGAQSIKLFPNPASNFITVETELKVVLTITSAEGKLIYKDEVQGTQVIDISSYTKGIYFLSLQSNMTYQTGKLIKN
ncbi:MAG: lamin tail domain-containing protein [Bacteroidetes bacterium]|nr:lamin tail domain-containing protein [Bacteroidota bacterium]